MVQKSLLAGAVVALTMCLGGAAPVFSASTSGLAPLKPLALEHSAVEKTHGWHRKCRQGWTDVHKHVRGVGRITCQTHKCWMQNGVQKCGWF